MAINLNTLPADAYYVHDSRNTIIWTELKDISPETLHITCAGCDSETLREGYTQEQLAPCAAPKCPYRYCHYCRRDNGEGPFSDQREAWTEFIAERADKLKGPYAYCSKGSSDPHALGKAVVEDTELFFSNTLPGWCVSCCLATPSCPSNQCFQRSFVDGKCVAPGHEEHDPNEDSESESEDTEDTEDSDSESSPSRKRKRPIETASPQKKLACSSRQLVIDLANDD